MLHKTAAVVIISEDVLNGKIKDLNSTFLVNQLTLLGYVVGKISVLPYNADAVCFELALLLNLFDVVVVAGGIGNSETDVTYKAVSKVFHEKPHFNERLVSTINEGRDKLEPKVSYIPAFAKVLKSNMQNINPVIYMQGLFLLKGNPDIVKSSFSKILFKFLASYNKEMILKRNIYLKYKEGYVNTIKNFITESVVATDYEKCNNGLKVTLSSNNMATLLHSEETLKKNFGDDVILSEECTDISGVLYNNLHNFHIAEAVEHIEECFSKYTPENVFISFNGGKDCTVLLHLMLGVLRKRYPEYKKPVFCLYVQSSTPFPELNNFVAQCKHYYNLEILTICKGIKEALAIILEEKPHLQACLMGTRRTDPFSANLHSFQMTDPNWPQVMRVSPLLDWHYSHIWDYLLYFKVPYCSLYDMGYTSLGNINNTTRNECLRFNDILSGTERYLPAHKLLDASKERNGRNS